MLTEDDAGARNDAVLVAYDPDEPSNVMLAADGPYGRGAYLAWGSVSIVFLIALIYTRFFY